MEDDDCDEEMKWKRKDEKDIQESLVVQVIVRFPLVLVATLASRFFPARIS